MQMKSNKSHLECMCCSTKNSVSYMKEGNMVLELIRNVRDKWLSVILISHNMPHVFEIADRIHVQRLGKRAVVVNPKNISMSDTVAVMTATKDPADLPEDAYA